MQKFKRYIIIALAFILAFSSMSVFADTENTETDADAEVTTTDTEEVETVEEIEGTEEVEGTEEETESEATEEEEAEEATEEEQPVVVDNPLPDGSQFELVAENSNYQLKADKTTGHFVVINKKNGKTFRSFPNPDGWDPQGASQNWQVHLQSPFMFTYVELNVRRDIVKESNFLNQGGTSTFEKIDNGYKMTYEMPNLGFIIPIEVRLGEDYVETVILGDEIVDVKEFPEPEEGEKAPKDPKARLVSVRLFPFLGAEASKKDGYLLLPDGPGALVEFKENRSNTNNLFSERIYGDDWAFSSRVELSARQPVRMPIFGIKSEDQAFLAVVRDSDVYANIVSAPSESLSNYNWVTAEHYFRFKFFQPTDRRRMNGFFTYADEIVRDTRSVRYYFVDDKEDPTYVDMAARYREYLMAEYGLTRLEPSENIKLQLSLLGGGTKDGFLWDSFLSLTTTEQATQIVKELNSSGVEDMTIHYYGWQRGGYEKYGGHFPVARKLGGNDGMKEFVEYAKSKGFEVYLDASSYTFNNTNKDGFRESRDGLQDMSYTIIRHFQYGNRKTFVSPRFMEKVIYKDFKKAKELGIDGYIYGDGIGAILNTDYNQRHPASRVEVKEIQKNILERTMQEIGDVHVAEANFYTLANVSHISKIADDYSYDLFIDEIVPFAQIALHGLVSYSFDYSNMGGNKMERFLRGIEYGALPAFVLTYEETSKSLDSRVMSRFYSTHYKDWEEEIASQYQSYNEALRDVQDQFIVNHQKLAEGVFETTYENGKRIIVNYNNYPYRAGGITVEPENFAILEGGN